MQAMMLLSPNCKLIYLVKQLRKLRGNASFHNMGPKLSKILQKYFLSDKRILTTSEKK